ncbi:Alcohol dehydrogenase [Stieleria bergensis]|uniref:Alcohol dehydrogenase n=1 Tax=Stieleria bergensis TaxID=2528025 RepID=A0A517SYA8_9BACT|nr:Alcohol dehydrogenase [Planctomycetes bacterium SV_7m_r]
MPAPQEPLIESLREVGAVLESLRVERPFVVLDETAYAASGADMVLEPLLSQRATTRLTKFEVNPKLQDVERGIEAYRNSDADFVIALGGGTAIDLAKLIGRLAVQSHSARELATGQATIQATGQPLMAIPTTAGTGSEATHFAVVYVDGEKHSVAHPSLLPNYAVVDPTLTESLPPGMTAATGLDALCQAIESIWSVAATEESLHDASEAATLAFANLVPATNAPTPEVRQAMCRASHLAGKAINITKTTAPHALSYALTSRFGVPHGLAVAVTLAPLLAFNAAVTSEDCMDPRGATAVSQRISRVINILGAKDVQTACAVISNLLSQIHCPALHEICSPDDFMGIAQSANAERLSNNPRRATCDQLYAVLSTPLHATPH